MEWCSQAYRAALFSSSSLGFWRVWGMLLTSQCWRIIYGYLHGSWLVSATEIQRKSQYCDRWDLAFRRSFGFTSHYACRGNWALEIDVLIWVVRHRFLAFAEKKRTGKSALAHLERKNAGIQLDHTRYWIGSKERKHTHGNAWREALTFHIERKHFLWLPSRNSIYSEGSSHHSYQEIHRQLRSYLLPSIFLQSSVLSIPRHPRWKVWNESIKHQQVHASAFLDELLKYFADRSSLRWGGKKSAHSHHLPFLCHLGDN